MKLNAIETTNIIEACNILQNKMSETRKDLNDGWDILWRAMLYLEVTYRAI